MGLLVAVLLVAWRLASGPVSIGFLTPYIENALAEIHKGAVNLAVDDTILTWAGWERTLDIRIVNLRTSLPSGEVIASVPEVSVSLSAEALLRGTVAPRSVEFFGPNFQVVRHPDGTFGLGSDGTGGQGNVVASMLLLMLQEPDPAQAMSYLKRISIVAGEVTYYDQTLGTEWHAPSASAEFVRIQGGVQAELDLDLSAGGVVSEVSVLGTYNAESERIDMGISFDDVTPADFVALTQKVDVLGALDLPLSGTVTMSLEQNGRIEGVGFDLTGKRGHLALPVPLAAKIDALTWAQRIAVENMRVSGRYEGAGDILDVSALDITLMDGEKVYLPAPIDHEIALKKLKTAARYAAQNGVLDIHHTTLALYKGPTAAVDATIKGLFLAKHGEADLLKDVSLDIAASARQVAFNDLDRLWPKRLGVDARKWVVANLHDGMAEKASVSVSLRSAGQGAMDLVSLAGEIHAAGVTVDYLPPMPPARDAAAVATFDDKSFDIKIERGEGLDGLKIMGGRVRLLKLDQEQPDADITLNILGPIPSALMLIDRPPLEYASELGIDPKTTDGTMISELNLKFPLKEDLLAKDVSVQAKAVLSGVGIKGALFDRDMQNGELELAVTNDGMTLTGKASLGEVPVQLSWNHDFRDRALFRDHYEISGTIEEVLSLDTLGVQIPDILARYMRGGAQANVNYTVLGDGRQSLSARVDLANITLAAPELGWSKPQGVPGTASLEMRLDQNIPREIPKFEVTAPNMEITGSAVFEKDGALRRIDMDTMRSGLTDVSASLTPDGKGAWELVMRGESLDASLLWDEMLGIREVPTRDEIKEDDLRLNVAVDLHTLRIRENRVLTDLIGTVYRDDGLWRKIDVNGVVGEAGNIQLLLDTDVDGLRYISIASNNAGAALKTLDLYDNILGGRFDLKAAYTSPGADAPLEGVVKVHDYAMRNAPAFAKLIGIMSLTGVLDALQGEGLNFDIFEAPFILKGGVLELVDSRASGPTIGVTASGTIDLDNKVMDTKGTVVPAYAINALLGKIPIIGELFSGPEKGGGLFAATYTMRGRAENVEITVNPLSVLAPGVLRGIFTGSNKEKEIPKEPQMPPNPKAAPVKPVTAEPVN